MFRPMLPASILWLATMMTSCDLLPSNRAPQDSTVTAPKVISAVEFLNELPLQELPNYLEKLGPVPVGFLGLNMPPFFSLKEVGKLPSDNGITPVIYSGTVQGKRVVYLFTYDKAGKELSRLQLWGDGFVEQDSPAYDEHYKNATIHTAFIADTMIEMKCYYNFIGVEKKACFFYHIGADGIIVPIPKDTISLEDYAAAFPLKEAPWHMGDVDTGGLRQISRLTPYFNFGEVYNDEVYAYGKLELDGLPVVLLYGQDNDKVNLITYNEKGNMAGSLLVRDSIGREGESMSTGNCRIHADGTILLDELYEMDDDGYAYMEKVNMRYAIQASGSIVPEEATQITITSPMFQKERLLKMFRRTAEEYKDQSNIESLILSEIPSPDRISVNMHFYQEGDECLVELFTRKADGMLVDRYALLNTLNKKKYEDVGAKDKVPDAEEYVVEKRGHYTKDVVLKVPGKDLHIDAEGRFVK